ncbi:FG-GAP repeat domain-containing protein [Streptomyces sp. NBC_00239]|uniref:FG-GAP repeat domain-containing protein n=1 Tax=Streptomyces sp. NBC_00239 TaxID=2903640 RepID=UPI002E2D0D46|nr:VCBS repeat-containing protein [Streptomyces sp. NBC_00239]
MTRSTRTTRTHTRTRPRNRLGLVAAAAALGLAAGLPAGAPGAAATPAPAAHRSTATASVTAANATGPAAGTGTRITAAEATAPRTPAGTGTGTGTRTTADPPRPTVTPPPRAAASRTAVPRTAPARPRHDLDGDGLSDLIGQEYDTSAYTFLTGNGGEAYTPFTVDAPDPGEVFKDFVPVGDLNGDARPELLTLSADGRLTLYETTPDGTRPPTWTGRGWQVYDRVVAAGDLTRDGRPDLLARDKDGGLYLYRGTGRVTGSPFTARVRIGGGWGGYDQLIGANDVDGDGVGDLFARSLTGDLWFYRGSGSAAAPLRPRVKTGTGWNRYNTVTGADDLDGDGLGDLLGRSRSGTLYRHIATGGGKFGDATRHGAGWEYTRMLAGGGTTALYGKAQSVGVTAAGTWWKYDALADGAYDAPYDITDPAGPGVPATMKFDYAAAMHTRNHATFVQLDRAKLYLNGRQAASGWTYDMTVGPGDLTGDGRGDLLSRDAGGTLWLHPGDGAFQSSLGARVKVGAGWKVYNALAGGGDYTNDGRADLLARDTAGRLHLYAGTGSATAPFRPRVLIGAGWNAYDRLVAPGDLDGDGKADLVARDAPGRLYRYAATGRGGAATFTPRVLLGSGWQKYRLLF